MKEVEFGVHDARAGSGWTISPANLKNARPRELLHFALGWYLAGPIGLEEYFAFVAAVNRHRSLGWSET